MNRNDHHAPRPPGEAGHIAQLDGLRAYAVLAVIAAHTGPTGLEGRIGIGRLGVYLFFVLSGYLITGILLRARDSAATAGLPAWKVLRAFYARRFLRIFPVYYLAIAACALAGVPQIRQAWTWHVSYLSNVYFTTEGHFDAATGHFWSLAVEEQFYVFWPLLVLFVPRRWLPSVFLGAIGIAPALRLLTQNMEALTPHCIDILAMGSMLAYVETNQQLSQASRRKIVQSAMLTGIALTGLVMAGVLPHALYRTGVSLAFAWVVHRAARGFSGLGGLLLGAAPVVFLGTISYAIYVCHNLLIAVLRQFGASLGAPNVTGVQGFLTVTLLSGVIAGLSWYVYERPLNRLKRYLPYVPHRQGTRSSPDASYLHPSPVQAEDHPVSDCPNSCRTLVGR
jgi:peptidoglycan/LPS O-acetylase OafA/YrhL